MNGAAKIQLITYVSSARGEQSRLKEISGTSLDKGIELDALAKLEKTDPVKRDTIIDLAKAGEKVTARTPVRTMTTKQQAKPDNNISARRYPGCRVAEEIAEWAKKLDPKEAPGIVKLLLEQAREDPFSSDFQAMLLMTTWNASGPEAQQKFMRRIKKD